MGFKVLDCIRDTTKYLNSGFRGIPKMLKSGENNQTTKCAVCVCESVCVCVCVCACACANVCGEKRLNKMTSSIKTCDINDLLSSSSNTVGGVNATLVEKSQQSSEKTKSISNGFAMLSVEGEEVEEKRECGPALQLSEEVCVVLSEEVQTGDWSTVARKIRPINQYVEIMVGGKMLYFPSGENGFKVFVCTQKNPEGIWFCTEFVKNGMKKPFSDGWIEPKKLPCGRFHSHAEYNGNFCWYNLMDQCNKKTECKLLHIIQSNETTVQPLVAMPVRPFVASVSAQPFVPKANSIAKANSIVKANTVAIIPDNTTITFTVPNRKGREDHHISLPSANKGTLVFIKSQIIPNGKWFCTEFVRNGVKRPDSAKDNHIDPKKLPCNQEHNSHSDYQGNICAFFLLGDCNKGDECKLHHFTCQIIMPQEPKNYKPIVSRTSEFIKNKEGFQICGPYTRSSICAFKNCSFSHTLNRGKISEMLWEQLKNGTFDMRRYTIAVLNWGYTNYDNIRAMWALYEDKLPTGKKSELPFYSEIVRLLGIRGIESCHFRKLARMWYYLINFINSKKLPSEHFHLFGNTHNVEEDIFHELIRISQKPCMTHRTGSMKSYKKVEGVASLLAPGMINTYQLVKTSVCTFGDNCPRGPHTHNGVQLFRMFEDASEIKCCSEYDEWSKTLGVVSKKSMQDADKVRYDVLAKNKIASEITYNELRGQNQSIKEIYLATNQAKRIFDEDALKFATLDQLLSTQYNDLDVVYAVCLVKDLGYQPVADIFKMPTQSVVCNMSATQFTLDNTCFPIIPGSTESVPVCCEVVSSEKTFTNMMLSGNMVPQDKPATTVSKPSPPKRKETPVVKKVRVEKTKKSPEELEIIRLKNSIRYQEKKARYQVAHTEADPTEFYTGAEIDTTNKHVCTADDMDIVIENGKKSKDAIVEPVDDDMSEDDIIKTMVSKRTPKAKKVKVVTSPSVVPEVAPIASSITPIFNTGVESSLEKSKQQERINIINTRKNKKHSETLVIGWNLEPGKLKKEVQILKHKLQTAICVKPVVYGGVEYENVLMIFGDKVNEMLLYLSDEKDRTNLFYKKPGDLKLKKYEDEDDIIPGFAKKSKQCDSSDDDSDDSDEDDDMDNSPVSKKMTARMVFLESQKRKASVVVPEKTVPVKQTAEERAAAIAEQKAKIIARKEEEAKLDALRGGRTFAKSSKKSDGAGGKRAGQKAAECREEHKITMRANISNARKFVATDRSD